MDDISRNGFSGALLAYIIVAGSQYLALPEFLHVLRWVVLVVMMYLSARQSKKTFREHTRAPFKTAVIFWITFFVLFTIKPGLESLDIGYGMQGFILYVMIHLIISFVLTLMITFAVRRWKNSN